MAGVIADGGLSQHPSFLHLVLLVFEAVLEVVCVSLPGYIAAQQGMFDSEAQKFVANLNVTLFTPCLSMQIQRACMARPISPTPTDDRSFHQARVAIDG